MAVEAPTKMKFRCKWVNHVKMLPIANMIKVGANGLAIDPLTGKVQFTQRKRVEFEHGLYETDDPEIIDFLLNHKEYGHVFWPVGDEEAVMKKAAEAATQSVTCRFCLEVFGDIHMKAAHETICKAKDLVPIGAPDPLSVVNAELEKKQLLARLAEIERQLSGIDNAKTMAQVESDAAAYVDSILGAEVQPEEPSSLEMPERGPGGKFLKKKG